MSGTNESNCDSRPTATVLAWFGVVGVLLTSLAVLVAWLTLYAPWPFPRPVDPDYSNLDQVVELTAKSLVDADRAQLRCLSTNAAWKRISDSHDFDVFLGYEGTFDNYLQMAGTQIDEAVPNFVTRSDLGPDLVSFWFGANPEGVTLAFRRNGAHWQLAFFSLGEIDPKVIRDEAIK